MCESEPVEGFTNRGRPIVLLRWCLRREGRRWRFVVRAQECDLGAHFIERECDNAKLLAAFPDERDVVIGDVRVAEGFGQFFGTAVLAYEFRAQVLEIPGNDVFARRVRMIGAGENLGLIVVEREVRGRRAW